MNRLSFKIECELEELETIMTALNFERNNAIADENNEAVELIARAIKRVADFTTNDR